MSDTESQTINYVNLLESQTLFDAFFAYPPLDFQVDNSNQGLATFKTAFNLLTTVDTEDRIKIQNYPLFKWWGKLLTLNTRFVGTTVTEYTPFPSQLAAIELLAIVRQQYSQQQPLTIIKDIPKDSPLLTETDNNYSQQLVERCKSAGFIEVEGQALAYVPIDFTTIDEYLGKLSASRRKDIRRKLKSRAQIRVDVVNTGDIQFTDDVWLNTLYDLYLKVYEQSEIHFDLLSSEFFKAILQNADGDGRVFFYWLDEQLVGYNICYVRNGSLIDKYIGLSYPLARDCNLYFISWIENLEYALANNLKFYIAGWTDPQVKASLGASFTFTRHLVWVRNPILRAIIRRFSHVFESDSNLLEGKTK